MSNDYDRSNEDDALRDMADDPSAYGEFDTPCFDCNEDTIPAHDEYDCPKRASYIGSQGEGEDANGRDAHEPGRLIKPSLEAFEHLSPLLNLSDIDIDKIKDNLQYSTGGW